MVRYVHTERCAYRTGGVSFARYCIVRYEHTERNTRQGREEATASPRLRRQEEEEVASHLQRPAREGDDRSGLLRESDVGSPVSPFSSPSSSPSSSFSLTISRLIQSDSGRRRTKSTITN
ncbi:hypothetical protein BHM03_00012605 [Ensete ventricosum]|nr:hypothetical protein BHM03_00012605 [Ensete ventricosum]